MPPILERLKRTNLGALTAGGSLVVLGGIGLWVASSYEIGELHRFGPGFFPQVISVILIFFGLAIILENQPIERDFDPPPLKAIVFVVLSVLAFAFTVRRFGGVVAAISVVVLAALAQDRFRPVQTAFIALALCLLTVLVFIGQLRLSMPTFPWG